MAYISICEECPFSKIEADLDDVSLQCHKTKGGPPICCFPKTEEEAKKQIEAFSTYTRNW